MSRPTRARSPGYVQGDGVRIWYCTRGRGEPLVLLHGGPGADHTDFLPWLEPLAKRFTLILFDQRGSGRSQRLADPRGYRLERMVADLEALRRHLGHSRWHVLGHSFGGILAQAYAVRHPRRIQRLVLAGTASSARSVDADFRRIRQALPARLRARLAECERRGIYAADGGYARQYAPLTAQILGPYLHAGPVPDRPESQLASDVVGEMWGHRTEFRITGNLKGFDFTRSLRRLACPVLVVGGDRDLVTRQTLELTRSACRCATLVIIGRCAHMLFVDQTRFFNDLVQSFLTSGGSE